MNTSAAITELIHAVRGHRVLLDADLAALYGVETRTLNQAVKRNPDRFPADFAFQITAEEWADLKSQAVITSEAAQRGEGEAKVAGTPWKSPIAAPRAAGNRSQSAMGLRGHGGRRTLPWVFTEHGAIMAASVLNSPAAVSMSVFVVRAFVRMREQLAANAAILQRLAEIDATLLQHDQALRLVWQKLQPLLAPPPPPKRRIGFKQDEP